MSNLEEREAASIRTEPLPYFYQVYGLTVESEVELPELVPAGQQRPDVQIRLGEVPEKLDDPIRTWKWCSASRSAFLFTVEGVAGYYIADGQTITIDRRPGSSHAVPAADIRLWLLGSAFAALIHQRGQLPLHVSAVSAPSGVWAFTGESGEGKSTLAGFLHRFYRYELISDDASVIEPANAGSVIYPGPRKLKLWSDALEHLNFNHCNIVRDLSNTEKFQIYLPSENTYEPENLKGLVVLESAGNNGRAIIEKLKGMEAFKACLGAVYRPHMEHWFKLPQERLRQIAQLCQSIEVYRFRRPRSLSDFEMNLRPLLRLIGGTEL